MSCYPADLITLFSSEQVEPSKLEDRVRMELGCVAHCMVVGQGREGLALLLSLDTEMEAVGVPTTRLTKACQTWFRAARFEVKTVSEVMEAVDLGIKHVIQAGIDRTNLEAERASQLITAWEILPHCFSLATGELGQTGKVNRALVTEKYSRTINRMYTGEEYDDVPRKRSAESFKLSHQLSQIVEDDEKSQRESQDKELLVIRDILEEEEEGKETEYIEDVSQAVREVKLSEKESSTNCAKSENSDDEEKTTNEIVEHIATIETTSKHDQNTQFEDTMEIPERARRISRS